MISALDTIGPGMAANSAAGDGAASDAAPIAPTTSGTGTSDPALLYAEEPDRAKADFDNIFDDRFTAISHEQHNTDEVCRIVELYQAIQEMRDEYAGRHGEAIEGGGERSYLVYGH